MRYKAARIIQTVLWAMMCIALFTLMSCSRSTDKPDAVNNATQANGTHASRSIVLDTVTTLDVARTNWSIPSGTNGIIMEADAVFAMPLGAVIEITNGFESGLIYFDKYYRLQRAADGDWQDMPLLSSDDFPYDAFSLAPGKIVRANIYWAWLYGELPPGEYRVAKSFLHRAEDGEETQHELYAALILNGEPVLQHVMKNYSEWFHPFGGIRTFRAEVDKHLSSDYHDMSNGFVGLLVNGLTPLSELGEAGGQFYVWDDFTVAVLNADNEQIGFADIPVGAIVEITFSGIILPSSPAHIVVPMLIQLL